MANLYGVANAPGLPFLTTLLLGNISCPAGVTTLVYTSPALIAPSGGYFYCRIDMGLNIQIGATAPNPITVASAIGAGSFVPYAALGSQGLLLNGDVNLPFICITPVSQAAWQGAGSTVSLGVNPTGQAVTTNAASWAIFTLLRAPDQ